MINEELACCTVGIAGSCHRDCSSHITQAVLCFIDDRVSRFFTGHLLCESSTLDHKSRDYSVKNHPIIKSCLHVSEEIPDRDRGRLLIKLNDDISHACFQLHNVVLWHHNIPFQVTFFFDVLSLVCFLRAATGQSNNRQQSTEP